MGNQIEPSIFEPRRTDMTSRRVLLRDGGAPARPLKLTKDERDALEVVQAHLTEDLLSAFRYPLERHWLSLIEDFEGATGFAWSDIARAYTEIVAPPWRVNYEANFLVNAITRAVSMITGNDPTPMIAPSGTSLQDRRRARIAQDAWKSASRSMEFDEKSRHAVLLSAILGTSFIKSYWNADLGRVLWDEDLQRVVGEGDVDIEALSALPLTIDPMASSMDTATYAIQRTWMPLLHIRRLFKRGRYVTAGADEDAGTWIRRRLIFTGLGGRGGSAGGASARGLDEAAVVNECYFRPSDRFPRGLKVITSGDTLLWPENGKLDNPGVGLDPRRRMELPFTPVRFFRAPDRFWGIGMLELINPIIRQRNDVVSQVIESINLTAKPKWMNPTTSMVSKNALTSEPGEVVDFNPLGGMPTYATPPPMPAYVREMIEILEKDFQRAGSWNEASQGESPGSGRTGVFVELLQAADETVFGPVRKDVWASLSRVASNSLLLMRQNYDTERLLIVSGPGNELIAREFDATDITGATDIQFVIDDGLGATKSARRANILDLMQAGAINPADPLQMLRAVQAMKSSDLEGVYSSLLRDIEEAEFENEIMSAEPPDGSNPEPAVIGSWQNHIIHQAVHADFLKSPEFRALPVEAKAAHLIHFELTNQQVMLQQQAMMEQTLAARGGPGEKGTPSPPKEAGGASPNPSGANGSGEETSMTARNAGVT